MFFDSLVGPIRRAAANKSLLPYHEHEKRVERAIMHLLLCTPLHILLFNPVTSQISTLRSGDGYYYGVTFKEGTIVTTHTGGYLQYFNSHARSWLTTNQLVQPHQAEWIDGNILVANTGKNCLSVFDDNGLFCRNVFLNSIHWDDKNTNRKGNHFNSVHRVEDQIYLIAHNYERPSVVWILSWPELEVIGQKVTGAGWAHNIWIGEWGMVICDSQNGGLYEVLSGKTIWKTKERTLMTRGLAVSDDFIFVGRSLFNENKDRYWKDGGIWILDRKTLQIVDTIILPGIGDVREIRLVGAQDACHNGQMINHQDLIPLKQISPTVQWSYRLVKRYGFLRRSFFPMSQIVRAAQMIRRVRNSLYRMIQNSQPPE
jgi:hypothetical protein